MDSNKSSASPAQSPPAKLEEQREERQCVICEGSGQVLDEVETAFEWFETVASECPVCRGGGKVYVSGDPRAVPLWISCSQCSGSGEVDTIRYPKKEA